MKTFDEILPEIYTVLHFQAGNLNHTGRLIINRDLNGRVRLIADEKNEKDAGKRAALEAIAHSLSGCLESRIPAQDKILYESSLDDVLRDASVFPLKEFPNVIIADRLLTENDWTRVLPVKPGAHRLVFYSIKGGVGRSTALAAAAWALAEEGKKVMVLDMDLESPGISGSLLPQDKSPAYGIADWLVEDLIDNDDAVFPYMWTLSDLSRNGEIYVVPAYGREPGEYISKMARVWMPKYQANNTRELWQGRLNRLIDKLEDRHRPDVVLIDSRAGIDEIASACITGLGVESVFLFSIDSAQTWDGYKILFSHWSRNEAVQNIRDRLQIVGALIPDTNQEEYADGLCEHAWNLFTDKLYDPVPAGEPVSADEPVPDLFNFDKDDIYAPHYPWRILWNRGFAALPNLYQPLRQQNITGQIMGIFGDFITRIKESIKDD